MVAVAVGLHPMAWAVTERKMACMKKTMRNKILIGSSILMIAATSTFGAELNNDRGDVRDLYRASEMSMDVFATGSIGKYTIDHISNNRIKHNGQGGFGLGLNYFFTKNLGIGGDAYSENTDGRFVDSASVSMILRLPIGEGGLAPYGFAGVGHQFELDELSFLQAGAGLEYRCTPKAGLFVDARMVWPDKTQYYGVARIGIRFAF